MKFNVLKIIKIETLRIKLLKYENLQLCYGFKLKFYRLSIRLTDRFLHSFRKLS